MPRAIRSHAPNHGIHITARTVGGAPWFTETIRDDVASIICEGAANGHAKILAFVVMPNHFHLVIRQGGFPLGWMMQRIMQRLAHRIRRSQQHEGHVFGRRYWSSVCDGPDYLRQAIVYTHLNPWKAQLCDDALAYRWSSHAAFTNTDATDSWGNKLAAEDAMLLFANDTVEPAAMRQNYLATMHYWMDRRRRHASCDRFLFEASDLAPHPAADLGDAHWVRNYSHAIPNSRPAIVRQDVRDRAVALLSKLQPGWQLDELRNGYRTRELCRVRRILIAALLSYDYKGAAISRCLRVSPSVVSDVASKLRRVS